MKRINFLVYPDMEELDLAGPFEVISYVNKIMPKAVETAIVAESTGPVKLFNGLRIIPDRMLGDSLSCDVLIVPGGKGRTEAMRNTGILDYVRRVDEETSITASVCTGVFILAEAGLLEGRRAATHAEYKKELCSYENIALSMKRVEKSGKYFTSGGVTAGIDLGLFIVEELFGRDISEDVREKIEYQS